MSISGQVLGPDAKVSWSLIKTTVNKMGKYFATVDRRRVCWSIAGLTLNAVLAKLPFEGKQELKIAAADQMFVIVNGWVLTREDIAASKITFNVV